MKYLIPRITYLIILAVTLPVAALVGTRNAELFVYGVFLLPILTLLYALVTLPFLSVTTDPLPDHPRKGDALAVTIHVKNRSFLPVPYVALFTRADRTISYDPEEEFLTREFALGPFQEQTLEISLLCRLHGFWRAGAVRLDVADYLRIFRLSRFFRPPLLLIYPSLTFGEDGPSPEGTAPGLGWENTSAFPQGSPEPGEVRPYQPDDSFSMLHRPLTSRGLGEYVLERQGETHRLITVFYEMPAAAGKHPWLSHFFGNRDSDLASDRLAAMAATFLTNSLAEGLSCRVVIPDEGAPCMKIFTPQETDEALAFLAEGCRFAESLPWGSAAISDALDSSGRAFFFSTAPSRKMLLCCADASDRGMAPALWAVGESLPSYEICESLGVEARLYPVKQ